MEKLAPHSDKGVVRVEKIDCGVSGRSIVDAGGICQNDQPARTLGCKCNSGRRRERAGFV